MLKVSVIHRAGHADKASYTEGSVGFAIYKNIDKLNNLASRGRINDIISFLDVAVRADVKGKTHIDYLESLINDVKCHQNDFMFNYRHIYNLYLAGTGNGGVMRNVKIIY